MYIIRGTSRGRRAWHMVLVPYDKIALTNSLDGTTTMDCNKLGRIIKSGWGEDPPQEILDELAKLYGKSRNLSFELIYEPWPCSIIS